MRMEQFQDLWVALQPIIHLKTGAILGHESLIRGAAPSPLVQPAQIFAYAARIGKEEELERTCRELAIDVLLNRLPAAQHLFLNVDPSTPLIPIDPNLRPLPIARIMLEISEHHPVTTSSPERYCIERWREQGYKIVLDDYGSGYSSLGMAIAVRPDMIKLDREIVRDTDRDAFRFNVLKSVVALWHDQGVQLVAEGIETNGELEAMQALGVDYGQGFYLGRPSAALHERTFR